VPTLFVVATPIGNLGDLSTRAADTLRSAGLVLAEDTRRTRALLAHLGAGKKPVVRVDAHADVHRVERLLDSLQGDATVALVTDAGEPGVSDPGALLVRSAAARGIRVVPIPGPSALTAAVAVSGLVEGPFSFLGFLPRHGKKRRIALERVRASTEPIVLFEAPGRIAETLRELAALCPARPAALCRELTKLHEETLRGTLTELAALEREWLGEVTLVLGAEEREARDVAEDPGVTDEEIARRLAKGAHPRDLSGEIAGKLGIPRRLAYARVLGVRERKDGDDDA
jgi:16S rRNA (cytidine1402-2'-O)-methyltransferase